MTNLSQPLFSQEIALTREESWQRYAALLDIDPTCDACAAEPKAVYLHGFDIATREAAGRILHILYQEEAVNRGVGQDGIHETTYQRIADEFGLEARGRHRG